MSCLDACTSLHNRHRLRSGGTRKPFQQADELRERERPVDSCMAIHDRGVDVRPFKGQDQLERFEVDVAQASSSVPGKIDSERPREPDCFGKRRCRAEIENADGGCAHRQVVGPSAQQRSGKGTPKSVAGADECDVEVCTPLGDPE